jgi:asparagine synthase (glutamine-hydrolysing)
MHSLEVRAPFLDIEVVDLVRRVPASYKFRSGTTKYILKRALKDVLPDEILHRPKKGFAPPIGAWFKSGDLRLDRLELPMLNFDAVQRRIASHVSGKSDERAFLWCFYALAKWMQNRNP